MAVMETIMLTGLSSPIKVRVFAKILPFLLDSLYNSLQVTPPRPVRRINLKTRVSRLKGLAVTTQAIP